MKTIAKLLLIIVVCVALVATTAGCDKPYSMKVYREDLVIGVQSPFAVLHTSDTHLTLANDLDSPSALVAANERRGMGPGEKRLDFVAATAKQNDALVVHTGDALDFVTYANMERFGAFLKETNALYIPGNHEMDSLSEEFEATFYSMATDDVLFFSEEVGGVVFVGINNANHKMTYEQLDRLKEVVATGKPVVLLVHVPLYSRDLYDASISSSGSDNVAWLMAVPKELVDRYPAGYDFQKADEATYAAYDYIVAQDNIKAILCGHLHFDYTTKVGNIPEYVTGIDSVRLFNIR